MRLEKIKTAGLAHLSYFLSADGEAAIIDPRRDIAVSYTHLTLPTSDLV